MFDSDDLKIKRDLKHANYSNLVDILSEDTKRIIKQQNGKRQEKLSESQKAAAEWAKDKNPEELLNAIEKGIDELEPHAILHGQLVQIRAHLPYLFLDDLEFKGSDGNVFWKPGRVYVSTDVERFDNGEFRPFTAYEAMDHIQGIKSPVEGFMPAVPTIALNYAILINAFRKGVKKTEDARGETTYLTQDPAWQRILDQFGDYGPGYGWQGCGSIIDALNNVDEEGNPSRNGGFVRLIDGPFDQDFPNEKKYRKNINPDQRNRRVHVFSLEGLSDSLFQNIEEGSANYKFYQDVTGQQDLSVFLEIRDYFNWRYNRNVEARLWVPDSGRYNTAWFGCDSNYLYVDTVNSLDSSSACRGVLLSAEGANAKNTGMKK